ncbi:hypothetical protein SBA4_1000008 [Candidatus Sulfopaludibacter sp. SbA4]|nr:hypothetical protein SBA4_1000008 [Candidatus Sulfopaludibacter sp. SbA4]
MDFLFPRRVSEHEGKDEKFPGAWGDAVERHAGAGNEVIAPAALLACRTGILKARWDDEDFAAMAAHPLPFAPEDAGLLQMPR